MRKTLGLMISLSCMSASLAMANAPTTSVRPALRQTVESVAPSTVSRASSNPLRLLNGTSLRPKLRPTSSTAQVTQTQQEPVVTQAQTTASNARFQNWIQAFKRDAARKGISQRTLDRAFDGVTYDAQIIKLDSNQSEFTKTIWDYLDSAASDTRVSNGKDAVRKHNSTLNAIEARYGVDKEVVAAVWGLESAYGTFKGGTDTIEALATLSFDGRRGAFFEAQLIAALKILDNGDVSPRGMKGSWAGAMGHTQFMPTSYLEYAVDFTGDGKRDIWSDDPTDALASTAAYLKKFGWVEGQPWGVEVKLPSGFDYTLASRKIKKMPSQWASLGVRDMSGAAVRDHGTASILLPAGAQGAAFMIFKNFSVIERYNTADAYVIGVGHLSDRLKGKPAIQASWPRQDRALKFSERKELQNLLTAKGFSTQGIDGKIGPNTINAVRAYQRSVGLIPDGYPSLAVLQKLR